MTRSSTALQTSAETANDFATADAPLRPFQSLRWRLPAFLGLLVVVMLGTFIWAMSRTIHGALDDAGYQRARIGAEQVAAMLERPIATRVEESARFQTDTAIRNALRSPTPQSVSAARDVLLPTSTPALRRAELWDARGRLVLAIATAPPDTAKGLRAYPEGSKPVGSGVSGMAAAGNANYFTILTEIRDDSARGGALLGYLRRFGRVTSNAGSPIQRLLGDSALVKIGSPSGGSWTDFYEVVEGPPALQGAAGSGDYRSAGGSRFIGAVDSIQGTPWVAWVGFPRTMIVAPARPFMQRMLALGLAFLVGGVTLAVILGERLTRPLRLLAGAAEQIAAGDYTRRVAADRRDEIGRLGHAFNTMSDRIEQAYSALRKSHEQTHFALAAARIGVWESDLKTGRMSCSGSMHLLHRLPAGKLPETCEEFVNALHEEDRDAVAKILAGEAIGNDDFDMQYRAAGPGGSLHYMEGKGRLIRDASGKPRSVLGVSIDVTERTRLESQFRQAQKMEAVGQLAGGVAHDFNNMLTAIIGHGELLLMELGADSNSHGDVEEILKAAESAAKLTSQLLAFSRHQVLQPRVVDANAVIQDTRQLLARLIGERITLAANLSEGSQAVKIDAAQLQQILMNLAINARDAMPDGGTLSIVSKSVCLDEHEAAEHGSSAGRYVVISVSDTGTGMDEATQARLFEPFFTTKALGKGTGLGLATVYGVVKKSGGFIDLVSELGSGTTFTIFLPSVDEALVSRQEARAPAPAAQARGETILIVDDNGPVRLVAQTILKRLGYHVLEAASGTEALEILDRADPRPQLMVTDVILPGMSGPDLYAAAVVRHPGIRAVFTSGYSPETIASQATLQPEVLFVEKPYNPATLADKVREALA